MAVSRAFLFRSVCLALTTGFLACSADEAPHETLAPTALGVRDVGLDIAEAVSIREELLAGRTLADLANTETFFVPTVDLTGKARYRLSVTAKKIPGSTQTGLAMLATLSAADIDSRAIFGSLLASTTAVPPMAARDDSGGMLLALANTLRAVGVKNVAEIRESAGNTLYVETTDGKMYPAGFVDPLDASELADLRTQAAAPHAAESEADRNDRIEVQWNDNRPAFDEGFAPGHASGGRLNREAFLKALDDAHYDTFLHSRYRDAEALGETVGNDSSVLTTQDIVRGEARSCVTKTLTFCDDDGYDELGSYVSGFASDGKLSPTNKSYALLLSRSHAVTHTQLAHPRKTGINTGESLGTKPAGQWVASYSGCGPENLAGMIWRRWVNGDDSFGMDAAQFAPLGSATAALKNMAYIDANGRKVWGQPVPGNPTNTKYSFLAVVATELSAASNAVVFQNGNVFAPPSGLLGATNSWLAQHNSKLRVANKFYYPLEAGGVAQKVNNDLAAILHHLVGLKRGPVVGAGDLGGGYFNYHYPAIFSYRITRTNSGTPVRIRVSFDFKRSDSEDGNRPYEIDISDVLSPRGLFYFKDDLARKVSPDVAMNQFCKGKPNGAYCDPDVPYGGFMCLGGQRGFGLQCPSGKTCVNGAANAAAALVCK